MKDEADLPVIRPIIVLKLPFGRELGPEWVYEIKHDGVRGMLHVNGSDAYFRSKSYRRMPEYERFAHKVAADLKLQQRGINSLILDGEIVPYPTGGQYAVFDLLYLNGSEWHKKPFKDRRQELCSLVEKSSIVAVSWCDNRLLDMALFATLNRQEGLVAKRLTDPYRKGVAWYKIKDETRPSARFAKQFAKVFSRTKTKEAKKYVKRKGR